jgi:hypothetical protein
MPDLVGVPLITPDDALTESPEGRVDPAEKLSVAVDEESDAVIWSGVMAEPTPLV